MPTIHGEKLVLRLLRSDTANPTLELLDVGEERNSTIQKICDMTDGLVIVAGPTGCGKSTTIYAVLNQLDRKSQNVITVEDPVEYELDRANQVQVNTRIGITFASTLPNILRQDPDIVMVGEIRDEDTAQMVMRAAISGHLVFSTVHAPNALQTVIRLVDMKVEPHMVVAALKACLSQRLLRKLCAKCKVSHPITQSERKLLGIAESKTVEIFEPVGCESCHGFGYKGRFAAMEILLLTPKLYEAILNQEKHNLEKIALEEGFKTMHDHAVERILLGETTVSEMLVSCPKEVV